MNIISKMPRYNQIHLINATKEIEEDTNDKKRRENKSYLESLTVIYSFDLPPQIDISFHLLNRSITYTVYIPFLIFEKVYRRQDLVNLRCVNRLFVESIWYSRGFFFKFIKMNHNVHQTL